MKHFFLITQYLIYRLRAKSAHGIHSPFVFDFIQTVLRDKRHFYAFDQIKQLRTELYHDQTYLNIEDFGAGSLKGSPKSRLVSDIAKNAGRNEKYGKLLFRIIDKFQPNNILELGTSLGLGTAYLAAASTKSKIITIEGSPEIAHYASNKFHALGFNHIEQIIGNFDEVLTDVLSKHKIFNLIFVDGNHREEATIKYYYQCLDNIDSDSIMIFDDIHWSQGMKNAWDVIRKDQHNSVTIDLFFFGLVFFKKEIKEKQHFILKY